MAVTPPQWVHGRYPNSGLRHVFVEFVVARYVGFFGFCGKHCGQL
jgi:hypothetical protein